MTDHDDDEDQETPDDQPQRPAPQPGEWFVATISTPVAPAGSLWIFDPQPAQPWDVRPKPWRCIDTGRSRWPERRYTPSGTFPDEPDLVARHGLVRLTSTSREAPDALRLTAVEKFRAWQRDNEMIPPLPFDPDQLHDATVDDVDADTDEGPGWSKPDHSSATIKVASISGGGGGGGGGGGRYDPRPTYQHLRGELDKELSDARFELGVANGQVEAMASAALDPGSPADLRRVADLLEALDRYGSWDARDLREKADAVEAKADAEARVEEVARTLWEAAGTFTSWDTAAERYRDPYRAMVRAAIAKVEAQQ